MDPEILADLIDSGQLPNNDLEAIRHLLVITSGQTANRVSTYNRYNIASFLDNLLHSLALAGRAEAALYTYLLLRNYCRKAHITL